MRNLILLALVCLASSAALAQEGFVEEFEWQALAPRWEWHVPVAGPTVSLTARPGHLRIRVPPAPDGFNQWAEWNSGNAPLLLTEAPPGDWTLEARLKLTAYGPRSNLHTALVVGFSKRFLLGWGPFRAPKLGRPSGEPELWCEPTGQGAYLTVRADTSDVCLRISRSGNTYTMSFSKTPEGPWNQVGQWPSIWPPKYVGLMAKTFGDGEEVVADIDSIRLKDLRPPTPSPSPRTAVVRVDARGETWPLHRFRFGQFIEHMFDCLHGGIWAELLWNRKFTGNRDARGVVEGWQAWQPREGVACAPDNAVYYCPAQSQRIELATAGEPSGISQSGLKLRGGVAYQVRLVARQEGLGGPVRVRLMGEAGALGEHALSDIGGDWTVREFSLPGPAANCTGSLVIETAGPGTLWLGAVSLMPGDNLDGMSRPVIEAIREIKPPIVRWPGGNFVSGYDWRDGLGERDRRPPRWNRAWGLWEFNEMGTDEFIRFCALVGTEPYICVNCGEGNAREAAAWVQYCNGAADTEWGRVRAANGHPDPYKVLIWGVGNEMYGPWQLGNLTATRYGIKAVEFADAMRAVDPDIKLVGVGVEADGWGGWNAEASRVAGSRFDWLSAHYYLDIRADTDPVLNYMNVLTGPPYVERMLDRTCEIASGAAGKPLPIAFDEWNVIIDSGGGDYALRDGLFACGVFSALHRLGDRCPMACLAQLVNVLGAIEANPQGVVHTPLSHAFRLYGEHSGPAAVPVSVDGPVIQIPREGDCPALDVVASLSESGDRLYVIALNRLPVESVTARIELPGFTPAAAGKAVTLTGPDIDATNTYAHPEQVGLQESAFEAAPVFEYTFGPHSATALVLQKD